MTTTESTTEREDVASDPHLVAVLAAAASVVLGAPVAIRRVTTPGHDEAERWSRAGRKDIMLSHQLRSKR